MSKWTKKGTSKSNRFLRVPSVRGVQLGQKLKRQKKKSLKRFYKTLQLFYAKNGSRKQLIFEKWYHFENWQKCPSSKGYSLCKMVSLGQKLKMPKRCEKRFYDHIRVVAKRDHWVLFSNLFFSLHTSSHVHLMTNLNRIWFLANFPILKSGANPVFLLFCKFVLGSGFTLPVTTSFQVSFLYFEKVPWVRLVTCLCMPSQAAERVSPQLNFVNTL